MDPGNQRTSRRRDRFLIWCCFGEMIKYLFCLLLVFFGATLLLLGPFIGFAIGVIIGVGGGLFLVILAFVLCIILIILFFLASIIPVVGETIGYMVLIPLLIVPLLICALSLAFFSLPLIGLFVGFFFGPFALFFGFLGLLFPNPAMILLCPIGDSRRRVESVTRVEYSANNESGARQSLPQQQESQMVSKSIRELSSEENNIQIIPQIEEEEEAGFSENITQIMTDQKKSISESIDYVSHHYDSTSPNGELEEEEGEEGEEGEEIVPLGNLNEHIQDVVYNDQLVYYDQVNNSTTNKILEPVKYGEEEITSDIQSPDTSSKLD